MTNMCMWVYQVCLSLILREATRDKNLVLIRDYANTEEGQSSDLVLPDEEKLEHAMPGAQV